MCELLQSSDRRRRIQHHIRPADPLPTHPVIDQGTAAPEKVRKYSPSLSLSNPFIH